MAARPKRRAEEKSGHSTQNDIVKWRSQDWLRHGRYARSQRLRTLLAGGVWRVRAGDRGAALRVTNL